MLLLAVYTLFCPCQCAVQVVGLVSVVSPHVSVVGEQGVSARTTNEDKAVAAGPHRSTRERRPNKCVEGADWDN